MQSSWRTRNSGKLHVTQIMDFYEALKNGIFTQYTLSGFNRQGLGNMKPETFPVPEEIVPVSAETDPLVLENNVGRLAENAREMGAAKAAVISPEDIVFDESLPETMRADDALPSIHWPPEYPLDNLKDALMSFRRGIFLYIRAEPGMPDYGGGPIDDPVHRDCYRKLHEIVTAIESRSFYMGHYLAMGFAAGNCRSIFCADADRCIAMTRSKPCKEPYKSRPSMAAAGMDALQMFRNAGWPPDVLKGPLLAGMVMVA